MKNARYRFLILAAVMALAVVPAAGCGGDEKTNEAPAELEDAYIGRDASARAQREVENNIASCMKAQGFDYTPVDPTAQQQALTGKANLSEEEYTEQFGYGISTLFGKGNAQADPNERLRASLSGADRTAYDRALFGENPGVTFSEAVDSGDFSELGGCTRQATEAVYGGSAALSSLVEKFDELDERIIQDQRMVKATEKWSACMLEKGYRYEEPDEIDSDIEERFKSIVGTGTRPGATTAEQGTSYDSAALTQLQADEVKIAQADRDCEKKEIAPVEEVVRPQYEKTFRQENQQLLNRVRKPGT
jgi:hypothetical protein